MTRTVSRGVTRRECILSRTGSSSHLTFPSGVSQHGFRGQRILHTVGVSATAPLEALFSARLLREPQRCLCKTLLKSIFLDRLESERSLGNLHLSAPR